MHEFAYYTHYRYFHMNAQNNALLNVDKLLTRLQDDGFSVTDNHG